MRNFAAKFSVVIRRTDPVITLMDISGEKNKNRLRQKVLYPLIGAELIEPTIKETPNSPKQSYALTKKAKMLLT